MSRRVDNDRAAAILVDAAYKGDEAAAQEWGVSVRSVERYRARLATDPKLAVTVAEKRALAERDWIDCFPATLGAGADFIERAAKQGDPKDPNMVHAVAGAMKLMAEIMFVKRMLDARLNERTPEQYRTNRPQIAEMATDGEYSDADA